ncbi:MEDS domain-containing protein [Actinoplanes sp. NPDC051861]|uniref:MEDS domain-containing protein n=1 Tax=Actinoplanes sp. NPDC051861 TaxID=3155170 RepID=UPI0034365DB1
MAEAGLLDRLRPGDHVCLLVDDEPLRTRSLVAFMRAGLRDQNRVIYQGRGGEQVEAELIAQGVDVATLRRRDQLRITLTGPSYVRGERFDPVATLATWRAEAARARDDGYLGMRAVGDMSWASRPIPGTEQLAWYEAQVNRLFAEGFATGVCLYDRSLFDVSQMRGVIRSHPSTVTTETDPRLIPLLRATRITDPLGLRLEGEADLSNRQALQAVVEHLVEESADTLTLDVSDLRFADAAAVRALLCGQRRLRLLGCSRSLRRMFDIQGAGAVEYVN